MKACRICNEVKHEEDFYKHPKMIGGRDSKCKECTKAAVKANRDKKIDYYKQYDAWRFQNDPRVRDRHAAYRNTASGHASIRRSQAKWDDENKEAKYAHGVVARAVRTGCLIKPSECPLCGEFTPSRMMHAHHEDYSKPLDIEWMCFKCHRAHHNPQNEDFTPIMARAKTNGST